MESSEETRQTKTTTTTTKTTTTKTIKQYDFNDILPLVGEYGWYQIRLQLIFILLVISPMHQFFLIFFLSDHTQWECKTNSTVCLINGSLTTDDERFCEIPATERRFLDGGNSPIEKTFNLYCENNWKIHISSSAMWLGYLLGIPFIGWLSDHYGRKSVIAPSVALMNTFGLMLTFTPNIELFCFIRFLSGLCIPGHVQMFILLQELVGSRRRNLAGMLFWMSIQLSSAILVATAYYIRDWKLFNIVSTAPYILLGAFHVLIPESPRRCLLYGKYDEAKIIAIKISKSNCKELKNDFEFKKVTQKANVSWFEIFRNKKYLLFMIYLSFCWFTATLGYFGLTLASSDLPGSKYVNFLLINFIEVPALLTSIYTGDRFGRKPSSLLTLIIGGLLGVITAFMPSHGAVGIGKLTMSIIGKSFMTVAYLMLWTWSAEVYPTNIRIVGLAINQFISKLGGVTMPWVAKYLMVYHKQLPFLVMGCMSIIGGIVACFLPETKGKELNEIANTTDSKPLLSIVGNVSDNPEQKKCSEKSQTNRFICCLSKTKANEDTVHTESIVRDDLEQEKCSKKTQHAFVTDGTIYFFPDKKGHDFYEVGDTTDINGNLNNTSDEKMT